MRWGFCSIELLAEQQKAQGGRYPGGFHVMETARDLRVKMIPQQLHYGASHLIPLFLWVSGFENFSDPPEPDLSGIRDLEWVDVG